MAEGSPGTIPDMRVCPRWRVTRCGKNEEDRCSACMLSLLLDGYLLLDKSPGGVYWSMLQALLCGCKP